jgi:plastocyanin
MTRRPLALLAGSLLLLAACGDGGATTAPSAAASAEAPTAATSAEASSAGGGVCTATTDPGTVTVEIRQRAFIPGRVEAGVGDVITLQNADGVPHTATLDDGSCTTENLGQDASGSLTFSAAGEYPFFCRVHPDMTGTIVIS